MLVLLRRQWKLFPVTTILIVVSTALYTATRVEWARTWLPRTVGSALEFSAEKFDLYTELRPAAEVLQRFGGSRIEPIMERYGSIGITQLWDGEVWRLVVSGFHHGSWLHLAGNLVVLAMLGWLMEPRCSRWWYVGFCLVSSTVSILGEAVMGTPAVGVSGIGFAMFGFLIVVRLRDPVVARHMPVRLVIGGIGAMLMCIPITMFEWVPIANIAHFTGFGYGALAGFTRITARPRLVIPAFTGLHLLVIPVCTLATNPTWSDAWVQHQISTAEDSDEVIRWLRVLLERRPDRASVRWRLALELHRTGRSDEAFRLAVEGWTGQFEREQQLLTRVIQELWLRLPDEDARIGAEQVMDEVLGGRVGTARDRLDLEWLSVIAARQQRRRSQAAEADVSVEFDELRIDPERPGSAAAGERI